VKDNYVPSEKYRNMFGLERNGYGCERVDLYLAQLEVAFKKIREDNRALKQGISESPAGFPPPPMPAPMPDPRQQEYIASLQSQLAELQEQNRQLGAQLMDRSEGANQQMATLMSHITALRGEADELRRQLRAQQAAAQSAPIPVYAEPAPRYDGDVSLIGQVLVEARACAEETVRKAQQEAEETTRKARLQLDAINAEYQRIFSQLQSAYDALRCALNVSSD